MGATNLTQNVMTADGGGGSPYDSIDVVVDNRTKLLERIKGDSNYSPATESEAQRYYNQYSDLQRNNLIRKGRFSTLANTLTSPNMPRAVSEPLSNIISTLHETNSNRYYYADEPQQFFREMNDFLDDIDTINSGLERRRSTYENIIDKYNNVKVQDIINAAQERLNEIEKGKNSGSTSTQSSSHSSGQSGGTSSGGGGGGGKPWVLEEK